ncbi:metallophosphoesterase family protein [Comamonas faecalis]|uniref:Metallophosphoesterase family protein n=1 Tax=Comamonas faecalis TaxID=1387849 RepID=A0ABP7QMZ2_9BURK
MRIQLLSDLHLEAQPQFAASPAVGADLLVLAGDIGSYQRGSRLQDEDFGLARFSPLPQYGGWPTPVVFVPGNHEYDNQDFDTAHARLRATCERLGLIWLERESVVIDGVRFIGTTLWSDFEALIVHAGITDPAQQQVQRDKAWRAANFYLSKTGGTRAGQPFLAPQVREQSLRCQQWLRQALAQPFGGPTVAVTHFAPSLRSADPRYGLVPGTAGFCNALDDALAHADLWLHGHLHTPCDYVAQGRRADASTWRCRVVANPLGYGRKAEQHLFRPHCTIDV